MRALIVSGGTPVLRFVQVAVMVVMSAAFALTLALRWQASPVHTLAYALFVGITLYLNRRYYHHRPPSLGVWLFYLVCFLVSFGVSYAVSFAR